MRNSIRTLISFAASVAVVAGLSVSANAEWPERPIQIIVPFKAGGDTDFNARMLAKYLKPKLGVALPVVNINGAGGSVGARRVLGAKPDGQTVLFFHAAMLVNTASGIADFSFRDFELVAIAGREPGSLLVVKKDSKWKTLKELVDASKADPGSINLTANIGATTYLVGQLLNKAGGKFNLVDVGGSSSRLTSVLGGNVDVSQNPLGQVRSYLKKGDLRALATLRADRSPFAPDIPTAKEQGYDVVFQYDYFFLFPKGTAKTKVQKFADAVKSVVTENKEYAAEIKAAYLQEPVYMGQEDARKRLVALETDIKSVPLK